MDGDHYLFSDCGELACVLGAFLGAVAYCWTQAFFLPLGVVVFLCAMLLIRWWSAALIGAGAAIASIAIFFVALTVREAASIQLTGRAIPTVVGGVLIASLGWALGRLLIRLFRVRRSAERSIADVIGDRLRAPRRRPSRHV
jgi:hypothetical protein